MLTFLQDRHLSAVSWRVVPILGEGFAYGSYDMNRLQQHTSHATKNTHGSMVIVIAIHFYSTV